MNAQRWRLLGLGGSWLTVAMMTASLIFAGSAQFWARIIGIGAAWTTVIAGELYRRAARGTS